MHVLILPSWYFKQGTAQLSGRMFHHHALGLRKAGTDAQVLFSEFNPLQSFSKKIIDLNEENVPTRRVSHWFPPKANAYLIKLWVKKYALSIEEYIQEKGKPDIIHAQSFMTGAVAGALTNKIKIPFVYTERLSSVLSGQIPGRYIPLIRSALDQSAINTTVSPGLQKQLQKLTQKTIEVIPNFYDPGIFNVNPAIEKNKSFTFITAGEPAGVKGLDILLEAYGQLRARVGKDQMQLILVDNIPEQKQLMKIAGKYGMENEIHWPGIMTQPQLAELFRKSHAYVSSSRVETFGKAIIEAMACGIPVIATKTDGASYILNNSNVKLVPINDPVSLSSAMEDIMNNNRPLSAQELNHFASARFSEPVVIQQWIRLYNQLAR